MQRCTHQPAAPHLGMSHVDLLGAWLLPSCCSSVSPCTPCLGTYRHRLLLLHLILLLVPDAALYLSENESWTPLLRASHRVLRIGIAAGEKAAARLAQPQGWCSQPNLTKPPFFPVPLICPSDWATPSLQAPTATVAAASFTGFPARTKANVCGSPSFLPLCARSYVSCARFRREYLIAATSS